MTRFKKLVVSLIAIAMIFAQCSTVSFAAAKKPTATAKLSIVKGKTKTITVNKKGTTITSKSFKSNNTKIAKVNKKTGKVTAVKVGNCKVVATVKYRATKKGKVKTVKLTTKITVKKAASTPATPTPAPDDDDDDDDNFIEYPDQDPNDLLILQSLITVQRNADAEVDDTDGSQYSWDEKGRLESIDWNECKLSGKLNLTGLTGLTELKCAKNNLTSLDVSKNTALTSLECHGNEFTTLDVSKNTALTYLSCDSDIKPKNPPKDCVVDLQDVYNRTEMKALKNIIAAQQKANPDTGVEADLDNSQYSWSSEGRLEEIDWGSCDVSGKIDLTPFTALTNVTCDGNAITSLDVSNCKLLTSLNCSDNKLSTLTLKNNTALEELQCQENELTTLTLTGCKNLAFLDCHSNQLKSLSISSLTLLEELDCSENKITSLTLNKELHESDNVTCDEGVNLPSHYSTKEDGHVEEDCSINFVAK